MRSSGNSASGPRLSSSPEARAAALQPRAGAEASLSELFREGVRLLGSSSQSLVETKVLLLEAARVTEERFLSSPDELVTRRAASRFFRLVEGRLAGLPLPYLTGKKEFWSLDINVSPAVLIPRPDTEVLVEKVLELSSRNGGLILDVGTGSGNIAVALAKEMPKSKIYAVDLSLKALKIARLNALRHGINNIVFEQSDLFSAFRGGGLKFDFVVSNPPYVSRKDWEELPGEIRDYEPRQALLAGDSGLEVIERLIKRSRRYLKQGGYLVFEIGDDQRSRVLDMFGRYWTEIETAWDLAGRPRAITARKA